VLIKETVCNFFELRKNSSEGLSPVLGDVLLNLGTIRNAIIRPKIITPITSDCLIVRKIPITDEVSKYISGGVLRIPVVTRTIILIQAAIENLLEMIPMSFPLSWGLMRGIDGFRII
jgi:hypothetical protein